MSVVGQRAFSVATAKASNNRTTAHSYCWERRLKNYFIL